MTNQKGKAIFQAALQLFAVNGFERTTMENIASQAKVAKGTLFYRHKSKEELFVSMIRWTIDQFVATVKESAENVEGAIQQLEKLIEVQTKLSFEHPEFAKVLLSEVWGRQDRQLLLRESLREYLQFIEKIIQEGIEKKEIRPLGPELLAVSIFGMTAAASLRILLSNQNISYEATVEEIKGYWLTGIKLSENL
ncbi:MAG: TetR/AcrR family transcriptional regulator [Dehalobacter sp. 4CP]|uniref:TetR/AcrR family transcriptional regulator n=1 Tax=Dehalobacter sp. CP TaxID=2594474 RepID=UPI0013CA0574|nr:TetR/AcrR family transcriptional regulator [Dehalobacter sp. 4CP]